jgi:uncharacterized membrane protein YagU involved in acid resistance
MRRQLSPLGAFWRGLLAGAVGAAAQSAFFRLSARIAPRARPQGFTPPDPDQLEETQTQTVARRLAHLAGRGPVSELQKAQGAAGVHYGFGAGWGAAYGMVRESLPGVRGPLGAATYGTIVWTVADNVLLPAFKLSAWPHRYPPRAHAYAWTAHLIYGAAVAASYELLRKAAAAPLLATGWFLLTRRRLQKHLPRQLRGGASATLRALTPAVRQLAYARTRAVRL